MRFAKCLGLSVVQTGTAGQLTSVFMRGLPSEDMQVLLDGIPINQGLSGAIEFRRHHHGRYRQDRSRARAAKRNLRTARTRRSDSNLHETRDRNSGRNGGRRRRIVRLFPRMGPERRQRSATSIIRSARAGSTPTTRVQTINIAIRPRSPTLAGRLTQQLRIGSLFTYSVSDTGNPNTIFDPKPIDHFLTERWLIGPHIDWKPTEWWDHKLIVSLRSRAANKRSERGWLCRADTRAV